MVIIVLKRVLIPVTHSNSIPPGRDYEFYMWANTAERQPFGAILCIFFFVFLDAISPDQINFFPFTPRAVLTHPPALFSANTPP
jgi:hypothetical protein